ncbi:MAG TPA: M50 family metallopeptidase, partial [Pyrinomonadaceae bacterium]|nr:M50 family metallopeptidase [Pyrinomonadaceae bacterium]
LHHPTLQLGQVGRPMALLLGLLTTVALFLSIFGHELSHALMARAEGIEIEEIILHPFGGLARLRSQPRSPGAEFRIALAGPAASFIFAVVGFAAMLVANMSGFRAATAVFFFFWFGNLLLAVFNLFPGYPLDGGRVLRAFLWHRRGSLSDATRIAGVCGQIIALALIACGGFLLLSYLVRGKGDPFTGLWTILVGLFLGDAARKVTAQAGGLSPGTVGEVMTSPFSVEPDVTISHFVDVILPQRPQVSFLVAANNRLHGILTLEDLQKLPRESWRQTRVRDVMRPVSPQLFVAESATMEQAEKLMKINGARALAVINGAGELIGFLQSGKLKRQPSAS